MSLQTIRDNAYSILQIPSALQAGNDGLSLALLNQIRLKAERDHDFAACKGVAYVRVTATTGALLSAATATYTSEAPSGSAVTMKSVKRVEARLDEQWVPMTLLEQEAYSQRVDRFNGLNTYPWTMDSPEPLPTVLETTEGNLNVFWHGGRFFTTSDENIDLKLYGSIWLTPYASLAATADFLITYGEDFLMWSLVCQLNHRTGTFLPRKEGSLDAAYPFRLRDEAWASLILWDSFANQTQQDIIAPL